MFYMKMLNMIKQTMSYYTIITINYITDYDVKYLYKQEREGSNLYFTSIKKLYLHTHFSLSFLSFFFEDQTTLV
jgi:hypothetical protein